MKLLRRLAQGGVVLLHKVPADLILGQVASAGACIGAGRVDGAGTASEVLRSALVLLLVSKVAVGSHGCCWRSFPWTAREGER